MSTSFRPFEMPPLPVPGPNLECVVVKTPVQVAQIAAFGDKFKKAAGGFGNNCSVVDTAANLFKDASKELDKAIKSALKEVMDATSEIWKALEELSKGGLLAEAAALLTAAIDEAANLLDTAAAQIEKLIAAIKQTAATVKTAICDAANSALKSVPRDIAMGVAGAAALAKVDLSKITDPLAKLNNLEKLASDAMKEAGIFDVRDTLKGASKNAKDLSKYIKDLSNYKCTPGVAIVP